MTTGDPEVSEPIWDDAKFIERVYSLAAGKGLSVAELLRQAKVSADYFAKRGGERGRNVISILKIAKVLQVNPAVLLATTAAPPVPETLDYLALVAKAAACLYVALDDRNKPEMPGDIDRAELLDTLMRFIKPARKKS